MDVFLYSIGETVTTPRKPSAWNAQTARNIRPTSGFACTHNICKQVRAQVTTLIFKEKGQNRLTNKRCRIMLDSLPGLLCQQSVNWHRTLNAQEAIILMTYFVVVCEDIGAKDLLGQRMAWYEPLRLDILKIIDSTTE